MQSCVPGDQPVYPVLRQLTSKQPIVTQIDGLLTPAECAYLVKTAHGAGFEASEIEGRGEVRSLRTSRTADLPEDKPVVQCIERRLATIAGMPLESLEPLHQVARRQTRPGPQPLHGRHAPRQTLCSCADKASSSRKAGKTSETMRETKKQKKL